MIKKLVQQVHKDETYHKGTLCFFSTESQCDLQVSSHPNSQRCEEHVEK